MSAAPNKLAPATPIAEVAAQQQQETAASRFLGYVGSLGRSLKMFIRYAAYTSDVGEAFRPVVHVNVVRSAYAISWAYVLGDVGIETYDKYNRLEFRGQDIHHVWTKRAIFQSVASMALPAFTIHSVVHYTKDYIFKPKFPKYLRWGPTACGLGVVPFLPFMYDHPVETACDWLWDRMLPLSPEAHAKIMAEEHAHGHGHGGHGGHAAGEQKAAKHDH
jgi:fission process protein 1